MPVQSRRDSRHPPRRGRAVSAERPLKTYTDAVVAIAQTLLILPLLESVAAAHAQSWTAQWLAHERDAVIWFALSFMLIGTFWLEHERSTATSSVRTARCTA